MADEFVFAIEGTNAVQAAPITLAEAGLKEREHLQEWVLKNPQILGPGVLVVTSEFDRWMSKGGHEKDRLDVLGLDQEGRLVVAELKRDAAPDTVEMQAINTPPWHHVSTSACSPMRTRRSSRRRPVKHWP